MKINNYFYPVNGNSVYGIRKSNNISSVSFSASEIPSGDLLSMAAQQGLENLHKNLDFIKDLFLLFAHYPAKSIAIKNGYNGLLQKNRNQGLSFALPDNRGSIIIRQLRAEPDIIRFVVDDKGKVTNYYTKGYARTIANINQNSPNDLPRRFRYMTKDEIKNSGIEEYIKIADEEIGKYYDYLEQFRTPETFKKIKKSDKPAPKTKKTKSQPKIKPLKTEVLSEKIKEIKGIFDKSPDEFPADITFTDMSGNKILGICTAAENGDTFQIKKSSVLNSVGGLPYLSIVKYNNSGERSNMGISLLTNEFIKLKTDGKPYIENGSFVTYTEEEVKKRNFCEKFSTYAELITKKFETKNQPSLKEPEMQHSVSKDLSISANNFDSLKNKIIQQAKQDADVLSDLYFKTLKDSFAENIKNKMSKFKAEFEKLFSKD